MTQQQRGCPICGNTGQEQYRGPVVKNGEVVDRVLMVCHHREAAVKWFEYEVIPDGMAKLNQAQRARAEAFVDEWKRQHHG